MTKHRIVMNAMWVACVVLVAGCKDGTVHVWEAGSGREVTVLRGHRSPVNSVAYSSDGTRVAAWANDGTIKIWDAGTGWLTADVVHPTPRPAGGGPGRNCELLCTPNGVINDTCVFVAAAKFGGVGCHWPGLVFGGV